MTTLFQKPKAPVLPPPVAPPPTIDDAAQSEEFSRKLARRRGRMATLKAGSGGLAAGASTPNVAVKTLLGG